LITNNSFSQKNIDRIKNQSYLKYKDQINCDSANTTLAYRICANLQYQESDSLLNISYRLLLTELKNKASELALLKESQKEWANYRNKHCKIYYEIYEGGSLQSIAYMNSLTELTNNRTKELNNLLHFIKQ